MQITYDTLLSDIKEPTPVSHEGRQFTLAPTTNGGLDVLTQDSNTLLGRVLIDHPVGTIHRNGQRIATWSYIETKHSYCTLPNGKAPIGENPIVYLLQELARD